MGELFDGAISHPLIFHLLMHSIEISFSLSTTYPLPTIGCSPFIQLFPDYRFEWLASEFERTIFLELGKFLKLLWFFRGFFP